MLTNLVLKTITHFELTMLAVADAELDLGTELLAELAENQPLFDTLTPKTLLQKLLTEGFDALHLGLFVAHDIQGNTIEITKLADLESIININWFADAAKVAIYEIYADLVSQVEADQHKLDAYINNEDSEDYQEFEYFAESTQQVYQAPLVDKKRSR